MTVDNRPRITIGKTVNIGQLAVEAGVALCGSPTEVVAADGAVITQNQLQAFYDAHVANANYGKATEEVQLYARRTKAQAVAAGNDTFTANELQQIAAEMVLRSTK